MNPKRKKPKDDFFESPEYQKLLADIGGGIDEAKAKGVDFGGRDDILKCGAYEDIT